MAKKKNVEFSSICIDASLKGDMVGVGIYNVYSKEKEFHCFKYPSHLNRDGYGDSSMIAEKMALVCGLEYAKRKNIPHPLFFTDNKGLSVADNSELFKKFGYKQNISWIPRELNKEADALSKAGHTGKLPTEMRTLSTDSIVSNVKKYTFETKIKFLKKFANTSPELEMIRMIEERVKGDYKFSYDDTHLRPLSTLIRVLFEDNQFSKYTNTRLEKLYSRLGGIKKTIKAGEFREIIRKRNLI